MPTKDLSFEGTSFPSSKSNHNAQYNNLNLNGSQSCQIIASIQFKNISIDNEQENSGLADENFDTFSTIKCNPWKKCDKNDLQLLDYHSFGNEKQKQQFNQVEGMSFGNNSTLSLHISAYENSIKSADNYLNVEKSSKTSSFNKMQNNHKQHFITYFAFEFPRQQEDIPSTPEIMQFKSSQKLLNSNESNAKMNNKDIMGDNKQLLLLGNLSPGDDHVFLERIQACINHRNSHGSHSTNALDAVAGEQIKQIVVGPDHIALLFNDNSVGRIAFDINEVKPPQATTSLEKLPTGGSNNNSGSNISTGTNTDSNAGTSNATAGSNAGTNPPPGSSGNPTFASAAVVNANRTAKIRRVMMASRRAGSQFAARGGVIVDRGRAVIPASSIPEDLIAQAQVVLQGKSREVIVRELQRTNLNVNEAVNNLLSREDDEEDLEDGADAYLPEELLSLLDAGLRSSEGLMEQEGLYTTGEGYEYLMARELSGVRRRDGRIEPTRKDRPLTETSTTVREKFVFGDVIEYWTGSQEHKMPPNVKKFVKIAALQGELLALSDTGVLYGWKWNKKALGDHAPHLINSMFLGPLSTEHFTDFETSAYRAVVITNTGRMGSFVDGRTLGKKISDALFMPLIEIPDGEAVESLHVCPMFAAVRTKHSLYWWGINPFNERRRVFDKHKNKAKKYISTSSSDIKIGAEVRTKSNPVYAANSIAVNLQSSVPMVGIMMESAWSLTETCRFRIYTPEQFDQLKDDLKPKEDKKAMNLSVRKRAAPSDDASAGPASQPVKETAWPIKDVFFIHEEPCNDIGIVQIIDGPICGIHFKSYIDEKKKSGDGSEDIKKLRLIRKDELVVVQGGGNKQLSAPVTFERNPQRVFLPHGIRKVVSLVVDNSGFRILVEKKGRLHLIRMSTLGKVSSDHMLPISCSAVCGSHDNPEASKAELINYGDDNVLLLRDCNGALIPLIRNAIGGYCEPLFLGFTGMQHLSVGLRYLKPNETSSAVISSAPIEKGSKNDTARTGSKLILIASMIAPSPESIQPDLPSLMQLILYCDAEGVKSFLRKLTELSKQMKEDEFKKFVEEKIMRLRADGNRTIVHAAIMGAFARTNANQADVEPSNNEVPGQSLLTLQEALDMTEADAHREKMDRQWKNMIAGAVSDGAKQLAKEAAAAAATSKEARSKEEHKPKEVAESMEVDDLISGKPVADLKLRQKNSIEILKLFAENEVMQRCLSDLLHVRDIHGHTPFISAIQNRAYGAATVVWNSMLKLFKKSCVYDFTNLVYNSSIHSDDSPLFILCYNDTCSFTWTGDEHINQDIFECKTCGLTGSLCCCTECANTCHRNHDCKLKRTSPTAYCDCWEKCSCKALVAGNDTQREYLLRELLKHTDLISQTNSRGEHLLLFLAKTVGRQLVEQENFTRRNKNRNNPSSSLNAANAGQEIPERDLEPPKFAQRALRLCLSEWSAVKSLILIGVKDPIEGNFISEEVFHLQSQNGTTHLDKFVYTLLAKCQEAHLDILLNTFITVANKKGDYRDMKIDYCMSRFIRSVIRIFALTTLVAPSTLALTINSAACNADDDSAIKFSTSTGEISRPPPTRAIAISGVLSLVRSIPILSDRSTKEHKKKTVNAFVMKCRRIFQAIAPHSIAELLNVADAYMGPVRMGFINPSLNILRAMHNNDPLEYIERYLLLETDLSSALDPIGLFKLNRKRYGSRRDTDDEHQNNVESSRMPGVALLDSEESDSDSENEDASRRFSSTSSLHNHTDNISNVIGNFSRATEAAVNNQNASSSRHDATISGGNGAAEVAEYSTDSVSSASDEDDSEDSNDEESENEHAFDAMDGLNNEFDDDEEMRDDDDEEEDEFHPEAGDEYQRQYPGVEGSENEEEGDFDGEEDAVLRAIPAVEVSDNNGRNVNENNSNQQNLENNAERGNQQQQRQDDPSMEIYVRDRNNGDEDMLQHANEEVAVDIPVEEANDVTIQSGNGFRESQRSRSRSIRIPSRPPVSSRSLTWAVPVNAASFNIETTRRDENNGGELTIRTSGPGNGDPSEQLQTAIRSGKPVAIDDSNASSEKTAFQFATVFAALLKVVDDLMLQITQHSSYTEKGQPGLPTLLKIENSTVSALREHLDAKLESSWIWLTTVLDKVETQLKFGSALNASPVISLLHGEHDPKKATEEKRRYKTKSESNSSSKKEHQHGRRDFIQYFFAVSRSHASENGDELPIIEYRALKTAAFVAEAFLFHANVIEIIDSRISKYSSSISSSNNENEEKSSKRKSTSSKMSKGDALSEKEVETMEPKNLKKFYQRSNSLCYPCISYAGIHNPFQYSAEECLPLSTRPQMLQPDVEKYQFFTIPLPPRNASSYRDIAQQHGITDPTFHSLADLPTSFEELRQLLKNHEPTVRKRDYRRIYDESTLGSSSSFSEISKFGVDEAFKLRTTASRIPLQRLLGRWSNVFALITQMYTDDLTTYCGGDAAFSVILVETAGFHFRQAQFRRRIEKLKNGQLRDLVLSGIVREKPALIVQTFRILDQQYSRRTSNTNSSQTLGGMQALRILARGGMEPNNGVAPPPLASHKVKVTFVNEPGEGTGVARSFYSAVAEALITLSSMPKDGPTTESSESIPLTNEDAPFFRRMENGQYAPVAATCSEARLNGFRNIGRMIGLCLQQREIFPIQFARHLLKFILNQPLTWYDLAFFDPNLFDSMRSIVFDEKTEKSHKPDSYEALQLNFTLTYSQEEGGKTIELKPGGKDIIVTRDNILEFLYLFVEKYLLGPSLPVMESIRTGVFDVIPPDALNNLTPEDLRLILCGNPEINVVMLESITKFLDESSSTNDVIEKYKQTFWSIVNKLSDQEKQDLIFFWTGSPTLPATEEEFQPLPTIMVRPSDNNLHLPTANTCISRLYLPLYSSKKILRAKLVLAIKARNFGFV